MDSATGKRYLEHLSNGDLAILADVADVLDERTSALDLRSSPESITRLIAHPLAWDRLLGDSSRDPFLLATPFMVFALLVHRAGLELRGVTFVDEWVGPQKRLPVFDVGPLRDFVADPWHRVFLVELLASYTHVSSGSVWVQDRRGRRRQRYSELDPIRLASLLDVVPAEDRPGIYRRLGDLALFMTGVFPDRSSSWPFSPNEQARLLSTGAGDDAGEHEAADPRGETPAGMLELLEDLGGRWYRAACSSIPPPASRTTSVLASVAQRFGTARRILNFITDRHLFSLRTRWLA
ncbi:MAG: hypothetical protein M3333_03750 [Actinomycetota bacterium]|nr:hypothetical protein [Actinomycetota bacterium]